MNENRPNPELNACDELEELLPAYILGATTAEEAARVRELIPQCREVAQGMKPLAHVSHSLMAQAEPMQPAADLRERILSKAKNDSEPAPIEPDNIIRPRFRQIGWWVAAILLVLLGGTNVYWSNQVTEMQQEVDFLRDRNSEVIGLITNENAHEILLNSTDETDSRALATLVWDADTRLATIFSDQLVPLDESQTYQLWLIEGETPVSAGLLPVTDQRTAFTTLIENNLDEYNAIAISIEPASGSEAPTTNPIAVGEIAT